MSQSIVAANWKMNNDEYSSKKLTYEFLKLLSKKNNENVLKILCVPFPFIGAISNMCDGHASVFIGAQNCSNFSDGEFTGEVSAKMLKSLAVDYVIVGHSERREVFSEGDKDILDKLKLAISNNIVPIFCCGEPLSIREQNNHLEYVINQLNESVLKLDASVVSKIVIAYEPVWAIGSGKSAKLEDITEMHTTIRNHLKKNLRTSV